MIFHRKRKGFWARRGITSWEGQGVVTKPPYDRLSRPMIGTEYVDLEPLPDPNRQPLKRAARKPKRTR